MPGESYWRIVGCAAGEAHVLPPSVEYAQLPPASAATKVVPPQPATKLATKAGTGPDAIVQVLPPSALNAHEVPLVTTKLASDPAASAAKNGGGGGNRSERVAAVGRERVGRARGRQVGESHRPRAPWR